MGSHDMYGRPVGVGPHTPIAPALNVTSIDRYIWDPKVTPKELIANIRWYYDNNLKPRLNKDGTNGSGPAQQLFVVPGAAGSHHNTHCNLTCYDEMCASDVPQWFTWIAEDPLIVGAMPWTWKSCGPNCAPFQDEIGARELNHTIS